MSAVPDFALYARQLGLNQALYPALEAFRLLGVSKSYGWARLVATGELPVVRLPGGKLTMVKGVDIAALIHRREQETKQHPAKKRVGRTEVKAPEGSREGRPRGSLPDDINTDPEYPGRLRLARGGRP
jgi:hypothetical protein